MKYFNPYKFFGWAMSIMFDVMIIITGIIENCDFWQITKVLLFVLSFQILAYLANDKEFDIKRSEQKYEKTESN